MTRYRFQDYELDTLRSKLRSQKEEVDVPARVSQLLMLLLQNPGQAFSKDALVEHIWPQTTVAESSLYRLISDTRQLLGDDPKDPVFIKTVTRSGYKWAWPQVEVLDETTEPTKKTSGAGGWNSKRWMLLLIVGLSLVILLLLWRPWAPEFPLFERPHPADHELHEESDQETGLRKRRPSPDP